MKVRKVGVEWYPLVTDNLLVNAVERVEEVIATDSPAKIEAGVDSRLVSGSTSYLAPGHDPAVGGIHARSREKLRQRIVSASLIGFIILFASLLRFTNLGDASFCHTEAWRANWIRDGDVSKARRFPPLFFLVHQAAQSFGDRSEAALRFPSALVGVACVILVFGFSSQLIGRGAASIAALLTAVHPTLVYYSRKQLEYSFEACLAVALLWIGVATYRAPTRRKLAVFVCIALLGLGLTFTSAITIVAWLGLFGLASLRAHPVHRSLHRPYLVAASILIVGTLLWYVWLSGAPHRDLMLIYYDSMEAVWPASFTPIALIRWLTAAVYGTLQFTLGITDTWPPLNWLIASLEVLAICAALGLAWNRCRIVLASTMLIVLGAILCGALRLWPIGNLRHSTFLIPFITIFAGWGLWRLWNQLGRSIATVFLAAMCLVIPAARAVKATVISPRAYEHTRPLLDHIATHQQPGDSIFVYYFAVEAYKFYETPRDIPVFLEPPTDRANVDLFLTRFDNWISQHRRVWVIFAHNWQSEHESWLARLRNDYQELESQTTNDASLHLFVMPQHSPLLNSPSMDTIRAQGD